MTIDRDWRHMEGRWFTGGYDELGLDIKLDRIGTETRVLGTDRTALKQGSAGQELKIYGANFSVVAAGRGYRSRTGPHRHAHRQRDA